MDRRAFLVTGTAALTACSVPGAAGTAQVPGTAPTGVVPDWEWVRAQFDLAPDYIHMSSFFLASHPHGVREEIERHRRTIDRNPFLAVHNQSDMPATIAAAAAEYLEGRPEEVALTGSTTMGLALIYHGLPLRAGQEVLTTTHDHYSHHESIRLAAGRAGATVRKIALYDEPAAAAQDEIVDRLRRALRPRTRVVGLTWVHSGTGVKLPLRAVAAALAERNASRPDGDRVLLVVDGVHGFGVEDEAVAAIGLDFFAAGTHKWILGPRGTGVIWGRDGRWADIQPTIPAFQHELSVAWIQNRPPAGPTRATWVTPGGFKAFEHLWALPAAFAFHHQLGRARVAERIHQLNTQCKDGLAAMKHVRLHTPRNPQLSSGLVCFEVDSMTPEAAVARLLQRRVVASAAPYATSFIRLAPSLVNSPADVDTALAAVRSLAPG
ncbi:MAG: aminotransferase class V-fold PLP-dependent enzyme [Pseudonocardiales bacterium]|nr:aminotransferase class V-fold PLP-dependent enzyme [Pseudonocardiales bacterium]MBV9029888.1 aminotransferase class V-fold PLP-dependent enzyme [Pseudonocardiales bacterium]MBW0010502.1 aminotransferase class V-fold PLP-dependent enzyme [Pseudonocardiales bacterium]